MSRPPDRVRRSLLFLVSPQNDMITTPGEIRRARERDLQDPYLQRLEDFILGRVPEPARNSSRWLHVGAQAVQRLRGNGLPGEDPFIDTALSFLQAEDEIERFLIRDEDWHPPNSPEFRIWAPHCIRGTWGSRLPERLESQRWNPRMRRIRANTINLAADPEYHRLMEELCDGIDRHCLRAGVMGVWTHIKVESLVINLATVSPEIPFQHIALCESLCASPDNERHRAAMEKMREFRVHVFAEPMQLLDFLSWKDPE